MFRRKVEHIDDTLIKFLRETGLETPLLQRRLLEEWENIVGPTVSAYSKDRFINNQTLMVKVTNPALRQDLSMMRSQLLKRLNDAVGQTVIYDIKIY